ncbi:MAG: helix-turn-helix domain-containing protein [Thermoguttaceae bacterium]
MGPQTGSAERARRLEPLLNRSRRILKAEREHILAVLHETGWVVAGPKGAAARLGMKRSSLQEKMKKLGISRPGWTFH